MKKIRVDIVNGFGIIYDEAKASRILSKSFGERDGIKCVLMPCEVLYLLDLEKVEVFIRGKEIIFENLILKKGFDYHDFLVFRKLRDSGYHIGSGLKFGFSFRVYEKGVKRNSSHSKWLVKILSEKDKILAYDLASNLRVAHSTKKEVLFAIIDSEQDVSFYQSNWKKF